MLPNESNVLTSLTEADGALDALAVPTISLTGLDGDCIRIVAGGEANLDLGHNAVLSGSGLISYLTLYFLSPVSTNDRFGISDPSLRVVLPDLNVDTEVTVGGINIGTVSDSAIGLLGFAFNDQATPARVLELIQALTYVNTSQFQLPAEYKEIQLDIVSSDGSVRSATINVTVAAADAQIFTPGTDIVSGTGGNDVFEAQTITLTDGDRLDGGAGNDTLRLVDDNGYFDLSLMQAITSIETIEGTDSDDAIGIKGELLGGVNTIDGKGGENYLWLSGSAINLTEKIITGFKEIGLLDDNAMVTLNNAETAKLLSGQSSENDTLILNDAILTAVDRLALHRRGIDTIKAKETSVGEVVTTSFHAPQVTALNGDHVELNGHNAVFLDAGRNAIIHAEDSIIELYVSIHAPTDDGDQLNVDVTDKVRLSNGWLADSVVSVFNAAGVLVEIGVIRTADGTFLSVDFHDSVDEKLVQEFVHALTYAHADGVIAEARTISIFVTEAGQRQTGIELTVDPEMTLPEVPPIAVSNLNNDSIRMVAGGEAHIDVGNNAVVTAASGHVELLDVYFNGVSDTHDHFGIDPLYTVDQLGPVGLSNGLIKGSVISVDGVEIGALNDQTTGRFLSFDFNGNATSEYVQQLLRALTYVNTATAETVAFRNIAIVIGADGESVVLGVNATVAPAGALILTTGIDDIPGTPGDDLFTLPVFAVTSGDEIDGGAGDDTLLLIGEDENGNATFDLTKFQTLTSIETIEGSGNNDTITISEGQFAEIKKFDGKGGSNALSLVGTAFNFTGKTVTEFQKISLSDDDTIVTFDSAATAKLLYGDSSADDKLILNTDVLMAADRLAIHRQGIDTITAKDASTGLIESTTFHAPQVGGLDGDHVTLDAGHTVFLDAGRNATITAEDYIRSLQISVGGLTDERDQIGVDLTGNVKLSSGVAQNSKIAVGVTEIGFIQSSSGGSLQITLNELASAALVQEFVLALSPILTAIRRSPRRKLCRSAWRRLASATQQSSSISIQRQSRPRQTSLRRGSICRAPAWRNCRRPEALSAP